MTATTFPWLRLLPGALLLAAVLLLFRDTATAMVGIWIRSETFTHAFLVPPISAWLVWRRRERLALVPARPSLLALLPIATACLLWMLGELASVNAATQFALVTLVILVVPAVYGWAVARELTFPLLFLYFAVPVGEFMVPYMMEWTADFTVAALQLSGLPVYREGLQFVIPTGNWSVVEACSGVRYLIASFMVGTLFAYLNFSSFGRRALFMLISLLVPILANWLRAYLIVMLGHLSGNTLAAGVDHLIYGWVFFGIVIGAMFLIGARFAEPDAPLPLRASAAAAAPAAPMPAFWVAAAAAMAVLLATQGLNWQLAQAQGAEPRLSLPAVPAGGWAPEAADASPGRWEPAFQKASAVAEQGWRQGNDVVSVWVGYYRNQNYERKLVTSTNGLVEVKEGARWALVASGGTTAATAAGPVAFRTAVLRGSTDPGSPAAPRLRVWQLYWVGGELTTSDVRAKLRLAFNRLLGRGDDGAVVLVYTALPADNQTAGADALLGRFVADRLPPVIQALDAARAGR
jgi:exosortase A